MFIESKDGKMIINSRYIKRIKYDGDTYHAILDACSNERVDDIVEISKEELNRLRRFDV